MTQVREAHYSRLVRLKRSSFLLHIKQTPILKDTSPPPPQSHSEASLHDRVLARCAELTPPKGCAKAEPPETWQGSELRMRRGNSPAFQNSGSSRKATPGNRHRVLAHSPGASVLRSGKGKGGGSLISPFLSETRIFQVSL